MARNDKPLTLEEVVGVNLKRLRGHKSQDEVAGAARKFGLPWSRSSVAAVEAGTKTLDLGEVVLASLALESPSVADLLAGDGDVRLSDRAVVPLAALRALLGAGPIPDDAALRVSPPKRDDRIADAAGGEVEQKAARRLGSSIGRPVEAAEVSAAAFRLWRHSLTEERDSRLGDVTGQSPRTVQARRGRITRHLLDEVETVLRQED